MWLSGTGILSDLHADSSCETDSLRKKSALAYLGDQQLFFLFSKAVLWYLSKAYKIDDSCARNHDSGLFYILVVVASEIIDLCSADNFLI